MIPPWRVVLDRYPADARPLDLPESLGNAGGYSGSELWKFRSPRGPLVVRKWPLDGPGSDHLRRVHAWLAGSGGLGFIPVPIASLDGRTLVEVDGRRWEVAPWMPGLPDLGRPPSPAHLRAGFAGLAAFHARLAFEGFQGSSPGLIARASEIDRLRLGEFEVLRAAIDRRPGGSVADLARRWVERAVSLAPRILGEVREGSTMTLPIQPCLRDARPDHLLFEGGRLVGLVDFGAMGRDSVAGDLARLLAEWAGDDRASRVVALDAYESIRPLSAGERRAIGTFERANALLGAGRWARWHFVEGRTFDHPDAVERGLRRGLERMDEAGF